MALVEIEAGPHRVTAAITRDAVEELGLAGSRRDRDREGDLGDDRAWRPRSLSFVARRCWTAARWRGRSPTWAYWCRSRSC